MLRERGGSLVGELGSGGMGHVYELSLPGQPSPVACKVAHGDADGFAWRRLRREARITAYVQGRGVPKVYESGDLGDGRPWFTMEAVEGSPLDGRMGATTSVEERMELVGVIVSAARILARAHRLGVVHRDVSAQNVLVDDAGRVVVIDWGLARAVSEEASAQFSVEMPGNSAETTELGARLGTPHCMSPEQVAGERVDARADVWALGILLWQVLAGQAAYEGDRPATVFAGILAGPPPMAPIEWAPDWARQVVEHALAPLASRAPNAAALVAPFPDQNSLSLHGETRPAVPQPSATAAPPSSPWLVAGLCLAIGLVAGGAAIRWLEPEAAPGEPAQRAAATPAPDLDVVVQAARQSARSGDRYRAEMLALHVLERGDDPALRGLLWSQMSRPELIQHIPFEGCDIGELLREDGQAVLCANVGKTASWALSDTGVQLLWERDFESHHLQFYGDDGMFAQVPSRHRIERYTVRDGQLVGHVSEMEGAACRSNQADVGLTLGETRARWHMLSSDNLSRSPAPCSTRFCILGEDDTEWYGCDEAVTRVNAEGETIGRYPLADSEFVQNMLMSANGRFVVGIGYGESGVLIDTQTGEHSTFDIPGKHTGTVAVSDDGRRVAVNMDGGTLVFEPANPAWRAVLPVSWAQLAFDPQGALVRLSTDRLERWQLPRDQSVWEVGGAVRQLRWLNSGMTALLRDGRVVQRATDGSVSEIATGVVRIAPSPNGERLAMAMEGGGVMLDAESFETATPCTALDWSSDTELACASRDAGPVLINTKDSSIDPSRSMPGQSWYQVHGSGQGMVLMEWSGSVWTLDGQERLTQIAHAPDATAVARSPDGAFVAVVRRRAVGILDVATGQEVASLPGDVRTFRVEFSPDGRHVAARSGAGSVRIYSVPSFEQVATLEPTSKAAWEIAWSPDSQRLAIVGAYQRVAVFELDELRRPLPDVADEVRRAWGHPEASP
ncbi:MAG: protein kinase [Myxococcota bacterium]